MSDDFSDLRPLFIGAVLKASLGALESGKLGKHVVGQPTLIQVRGRPGFVHVTRRDQTTLEARVKGVIIYEEDYPVEFREEYGTPTIQGKSVHPSMPAFVDPNVPPHALSEHADFDLTGLADKFVIYYDDASETWLVGNLATLLRIVAGSPLSTDPGEPGEVRYDASFLYVCVATDTWKRTALSTY